MLFLALLACKGTTPDDKTTDSPLHSGDTQEESVPLPDLSAERIEQHLLEATLTVAEPLDHDALLACRASDDDTEVHLLDLPTGQTEARLMALREVAYDCQLVGEGVPSRTTLTETALPEPRPELTRSIGEDIPKYNLLDLSDCEENNNSAVLLDDRGRVRWNHPLPDIDPLWELDDLGDGRLLIGGSASPSIISWDHETLHKASFQGAEAGGDTFHHEARMLHDGSILTLILRPNQNADQFWIGFMVRRYDPDAQEILWDWHSQFAYDDGVLPSADGEVAYGANWADIQVHGDGERLLVNACLLGKTLAIDVETGEVEWVFGEGGDFTPLNPDGSVITDNPWPLCSHGIEVEPERILMFDNNREEGPTRIVVWDLDEEAKTATRTLLWQEDWYEKVWGDADWIEDEEILVGRGHNECFTATGGVSEILHLTQDGEITRRLSFTDGRWGFYRLDQIDGCLFNDSRMCLEIAERVDSLGLTWE